MKVDGVCLPLLLLLLLAGLTAHSARAHDPADSLAHDFSVQHNHPESVEEQAAVLKAMREHCEIRMREERRLLKQMRTDARVRGKADVSEGGEPTTEAQDSGDLREDAKVSDEERDAANQTKENGSRERKSENHVLRENVSGGVKENGSVATHCPTTFDDVYCWPRTPADTLVTIPCPAYVQGFPRGSHASRYCTSQGTWYRLDGGNSSWTNYSQCSTTFVVPESINMTLSTWVPVVRVVSYIGYSVSLATLLVAFTVLACIKRLRCPRNTLHMHLFLSFICRALGALARDNKEHGLLTPESHMDGGTWGCRLFTGLWQYFILANYAWILMEGLYLHNLIFLALFTDNSAITLYIVLGWGLPLVLVLGWVTARVTAENTLCWFTNERPWVFWTFIRGPISISIVVSFALFLNIARELLLKLKSSTTPESRGDRYRRWARSTLVLVPLFGVHYAALLGFTYFMGKNHTIELMWLFTDQFFASFQGFFVATLYCLLNAEVRSELRKIWHRWRLNKESEKGFNFHSAFSHSRTYFSRGPGTQGTIPPGGRRRAEAVAPRGMSSSLPTTTAKINGSAAQTTCLSVHDKSMCDEMNDLNNQLSVTMSLAVVELQQPRHPHQNLSRAHTNTTNTASGWYDAPPDAGDVENALVLKPLTLNAHTTHEVPSVHETSSSSSHREDSLRVTPIPAQEPQEDMGSDSGLGELPPPSTILYDTGDSCEGSPLLASTPRLTESTF
ncbi:glucagon receptor-like [Panulirus ornatus]|uniref:glucagon receptor-like n=1 Tax=Panulirus ornatus TaxID=150431 RepID=UPI003A870FCB